MYRQPFTFGFMNNEIIRHTCLSERLVLVNQTAEMIASLLIDINQFASFLGIAVPARWTEFGSSPFEYALQKIKRNPAEAVWWSWLPILVSENMLIGNCGYKGPPVDGAVEIGYEVAEAYRDQGYATEIAKALIENALTYKNVDTIIAHTLSEENASVHVLRKCGFQYAGETEDPEDGAIWKWQLLS